MKKYRTGEVQELTGVSAKTIQRWTGERGDKSKNQGLFTVEVDELGYRIYTEEDVVKISIINLLNHFGIKYCNIRDLLARGVSLHVLLDEHLLRLRGNIEKNMEITNQIGNILQAEKEDDQYRQLHELSRWLNLQGRKGEFRVQLGEIKQVIFQYPCHIKEQEKEFSRKISEEDWATLHQKIHNLGELIEKIDRENLYIRSQCLGISSRITDNNSALFDFWESRTGRIILETGDTIYDIYDITYSKYCLEGGISLMVSGGKKVYPPSILGIRERIKELLRLPYLCTRDHHDGYPLLHKLCLYSDINEIKRAIALGCELDSRDKHGMTALSTTIQEKKPTIAQLLVSNGAKLDDSAIQELYCQEYSDLKIAVDAQADPVVKFFLHSLYYNETESAIFCLTAHGAHLTRLFFEKYSGGHGGLICYRLIEYHRNFKLMKVLLQNIGDKKTHSTMMSAAIEKNDSKMIKILLEVVDVNLVLWDRTFLDEAVLEHNLEIIKILLDAGADVEHCNNEGILFSVGQLIPHKRLFEALDIISLLLQYGKPRDVFCHFNILNSVAKQYDLSPGEQKPYGKFDSKSAWNQALSKIAEIIIDNLIPFEQNALFKALIYRNQDAFEIEFAQFCEEYTEDWVPQVKTMLTIVDGFLWYNSEYIDQYTWSIEILRKFAGEKLKPNQVPLLKSLRFDDSVSI